MYHDVLCRVSEATRRPLPLQLPMDEEGEFEARKGRVKHVMGKGVVVPVPLLYPGAKAKVNGLSLH